MEEDDGYRLHYQAAEPGEISTYRNLIQKGMENVELLVFNQKTEMLESLGLTEEKLLEEWEVFIKDY